VIGVADDMKGQVPRGVRGCSRRVPPQDGLVDELVAAVRQNIGAVASLKRVDVVAALPKTRSGKILRKTMRGNRRRSGTKPPPSTIEDATVLDALKPVLQFPDGVTVRPQTVPPQA